MLYQFNFIMHDAFKILLAIKKKTSYFNVWMDWSWDIAILTTHLGTQAPGAEDMESRVVLGRTWQGLRGRPDGTWKLNDIHDDAVVPVSFGDPPLGWSLPPLWDPQHGISM